MKATRLLVLSTLRWAHIHPSTRTTPHHHSSPHMHTDSLSHQPPGNKQMYFSLTCSIYYSLELLFILEIITASGYYLTLSLYHTIHNPKSLYFYIKLVVLPFCFHDICALDVTHVGVALRDCWQKKVHVCFWGKWIHDTTDNTLG